MDSVGVAELRQYASALLRRVERGETIQVTDRGRPVAVLGPLPEGGMLERLSASGELSPAKGSIDDLPDPLPPISGRELPSERLLRARER